VLSVYTWTVRPALFSLDAERAHELTIAALGWSSVVNALRWLPRARPDGRLAQQVGGLSFDNPVGLAAGLDKQGTAAAAWAALGFGFVEIGTVTPRPQPGNPRPRLFRLPADRAIINRFGFNSVGAAGVAQNLAAALPIAPRVGVNLGRNRQTPNEQAADDYVRTVEVLHPYADFFVVNVSSPNTSGLRDLQDSRALRRLVEQVVTRAREITTRKTIPVLVKVSPDMAAVDLLASVDAALEGGAAGIIATNTTVSRSGLRAPAALAGEGGGLSGAPLKPLANDACRTLYAHVGRRAPIIGVGGIFTADDAYERIRAGASLVQLYTGLIYEGPGIVARIVRGLGERLSRDGISSISEVIGIDVR
jgi:dihydroorotate dehydrogenase